jgi:hypothetical protein
METVCYFQRDYITFLNDYTISVTQASENRGKASIEKSNYLFSFGGFLGLHLCGVGLCVA